MSKEKGNVYILSEGGSLYKIGCTRTSVENRIKSLQTGNPNVLSVVAFHETSKPYKMEKMLHNYFKESHIQGEWYDLSRDQIDEVGTLCERFQLVIDSLENNPFW